MAGPVRGLHETLITEALAREIESLSRSYHVQKEPLRPADAADRLARHLAALMGKALSDVPEDRRASFGSALVRALTEQIQRHDPENSVATGNLAEPPTVLHSVRKILPAGDPEEIPSPLIPLLDTALLTNSPGEPRVGHQISTEIESADRIDLVMAFIRRSGLGPLMDGLKRHCASGRSLRVLTTTYTGSTEALALDALRKIGAEVRVSYETDNTRLHAKAWLFHRRSGFSTAYVGSSNLTHSAQITGLEWNVRVSGARNPEVVDKIAAVFRRICAR